MGPARTGLPRRGQSEARVQRRTVKRAEARAPNPMRIELRRELLKNNEPNHKLFRCPSGF
jgi:hypothetical protein